MTPFRHLLSPATKFIWTNNLEDAFVASKKKIIEMIQIGVFASRHEVGDNLLLMSLISDLQELRRS